MHPKTCPICSSTAEHVGTKQGRRTNRLFNLCQCGKCGFAYVEDPWTDYAQIYDEAYYKGQGSDPWVDYAFEYEHPLETIRQYEWQGLYSIVKKLAPDRGKWLDLGCGNGGLVRYAKSQGEEAVFGHDTGAWATKALRDGLPILDEQSLAAQEGTFDIITSIEVIEHVTDPIAFLRSARKLLKKDGLLFLTTGNARKAPKSFPDWSYVYPEIHVSYFTPEALALAFEKSGFSPEHHGRIDGWSNIIRFKILKNLKVRQTSWIERVLPWSLLTPAIDAHFKLSAHPAGRAI